MFWITRDPSSGSSMQCLAKITVMVLSRPLIWKQSVLWQHICPWCMCVLHSTVCVCTAQYCVCVLHSTACVYCTVLCVLHCTACVYCTVVCAALRCTVLRVCTAQYCAALYCTVLRVCTALYCVYCTALHCAALYCTVLHSTVCVYCTVLHCLLCLGCGGLET